jgi:hypothetical protein
MAAASTETHLPDTAGRDLEDDMSGHAQPRNEKRPALRALGVLVVLVVLGSLVVALRNHGSGGAPPPPPAQLPPAAAVVAGAPTGSSGYVGPAAPAAAQRFRAWRGAKIGFVVDCLSSRSWNDIQAPDWWLTRWNRTGLPLVLGIPMLPDDRSTTIAQGALGTYDHYFHQLAIDLVRHGDAHASLRIGWEMTGAWYRWSAQPNPTAWIAYYRHIVTAMRSAPGEHFTFDWNPNMGESGMTVAAAYPGDAYVDMIGMDVYDWKWNDPVASPAVRWSWILSQPSGLNWLSNFAAAHHKPIALPEWGLAHPKANDNGGGGDDPYFVRHLLAWARSHNVAYEAYFNDGAYAMSQFPHAAQAYRQVEQSYYG